MAGNMPLMLYTDEPIQIATIDPNESSKFQWDSKLIRDIFCAEEIANLPVAIISIAGAYRQGKSFLLNFFLMFLQALEKSGAIRSNNWDEEFEWLADDQKINGFLWKAGSERVTTGIWMWGRPIIVTTRNKTRMAIVLLDTQGAFDSISTENESKNIFALSTGLSSVQIYNVSKMFQEDQMQHLAFFAQCGQAISERNSQTPNAIAAKKFQKLLIVIRDHQNDRKYPMGKIGGTMLVDDALKETNSGGIVNQDASIVRGYIRDCFETISGFNLPYPGSDVARETRNFNGDVSKIDEEFKEFVKKLVVDTVLTAMLEPKSVDGELITCDFVPNIFEQFVSGCEKHEVVRYCTAIENVKYSRICTIAACKSIKYYMEAAELVCNHRIPTDEEMDEIVEKALLMFSKELQHVPKDHPVAERHREELLGEIQKLQNRYKALQEPKRILHTVLGIVWSTIIFIEQCVPLLNKSNRNHSVAKLTSNGVALVATAVSLPLLFVPGLTVLPLALGGVAFTTQIATRVSAWALMKHLKNEKMNEIIANKEKINEYLKLLEETEAVLQSEELRLTTVGGFRFASKVAVNSVDIALSAMVATADISVVAGHSSRIARFSIASTGSIGQIARVAGVPLIVFSIVIDAYDTFKLFQNFNKPSELSAYLENTVLVEFEKARNQLTIELNKQLGVPDSTETVQMENTENADISRHESLSSSFSEFEIISRERSDSGYQL